MRPAWDIWTHILLFSIYRAQTTPRDSIIIGASPNIVTDRPPTLAPRCAGQSLVKHYSLRLMRLMQSADAFNPTNLHWVLISHANIPLMQSIMRNRKLHALSRQTITATLFAHVFQKSSDNIQVVPGSLR